MGNVTGLFYLRTPLTMLCRKAPATVNDGEIAVGSNEELHAAPLSAKRLLALRARGGQVPFGSRAT
jgi:hypothetical protein